MRFNELQDVLREQPFEPFRIRMSTGDSYVIRHPKFAALLRTGIVVGVPSSRDGMPDRFDQCELLHVVSIEPTNGTKRRPKRKPRSEQ